MFIKILAMLIIFDFITGCQPVYKKSIVNYLQKGPNILYVEIKQPKEGNVKLYGNLVLLNVKTGKKNNLLNGIRSSRNPQLINDGDQILFAYDFPFNKGYFDIYDRLDGKYKEFSIEQRLNFNDRQRMIYDYTTLNDSTIIFDLGDTFYKYSFLNNQLDTIKVVKGKNLQELIYNRSMVYFTYSSYDDSTQTSYLGIYKIFNDSLKLTKEKAIRLGNVSPDGKRIVFSNLSDEIVFYNIITDSIYYIDENSIGGKATFGSPYFLSDSQLLLLGFQQDEQLNSDFYIYDIQKQKIIKRLTNDSMERNDIQIYY